MNKFILGVIVLLAGFGVGWFVRGSVPTPQPQSEITQQEEVAVTPTPTMEVVATAAVQYTANGFSPATLSVKRGTTVIFTNASNGSMWVASAVHPTHQLLPGFDQKQSVTAGGIYQYTFTAVGTWQYHNNMNPQDEGTVVVIQ